VEKMTSFTANSHPAFSRSITVSWICAGAAMFLVLSLRLLDGLLAGLLVYELVHLLAPALQKRLTNERARLFAVAALAILTVAILAVLTLCTIAFFKNYLANPSGLTQKVAHIFNDARASLPAWIVELLPGSADEIKALAANWLEDNGKEIRQIGSNAMHLSVHVLVGMVIGALVSLRVGPALSQMHPLAAALIERVRRFAEAFRRIVFAQVRISFVNTIFTGIFLFLILPLFGVRLPLTNFLVAITFFTGLLPIIGNLISNTLITIVSLSVSIYVAIAALIFLVVLHKLEYFLNARIVGSQIQARAWELLLAMIVMDAAFGIPGLIAAPIYYAYITKELSDAGLI
jgi:predicted PurR-regulated permease PerM